MKLETNVKTHLFKIDFKNDNLNGSTTIIAYLNPNTWDMLYINTITNKFYKSWEKMVLEEYKRRGLISEKFKMFSNVIWKETTKE